MRTTATSLVVAALITGSGALGSPAEAHSILAVTCSVPIPTTDDDHFTVDFFVESTSPDPQPSYTVFVNQADDSTSGVLDVDNAGPGDVHEEFDWPSSGDSEVVSITVTNKSDVRDTVTKDCPFGGGEGGEHYKSYRVSERAEGDESDDEGDRKGKFAKRTALLEDQFGREEVLVQKPRLLLNPVAKNIEGSFPEGILQPNVHLVCYSIKDLRGDEFPRFVKRDVVVGNQFGDAQHLTVKKPESLCLPASKTRSGTPGDVPTTLDHYKCYAVDGRGAFERRAVTLVDQFGPDATEAGKAKQLCNPVVKNNEATFPAGLLQPLAHLVCYELKPKDHEKLFVATRDQFGLLALKVKHSETLCLPSAKTDPGAP